MKLSLCLDVAQGLGVMEFILIQVFEAEDELAAAIHLLVDLIQEIRGPTFRVEVHLVV